MGDYLIRTIAKDAGLRVLVATSKELAQEAATNHETTPVATAVLAEALTGAALIGATLKVQHRIAMKFESDGPLQKVLVESDAYGRVRGYVGIPQPAQVDANPLGHVGLLTVVKDVRLKELVESVVPTAGDTIAQELTLYLNQSEQIPSHISIGVSLADDGKIAAAGGILIQALPPYQPEAVQQLVNRLQELPPIEAMLESGRTPEQIVADIYGEIEYDILETRTIQFQCRCSWDRSAQALITLGRQEIEHLVEEGEAVVTCPFCHKSYVFSREALEDLLLELDE